MTSPGPSEAASASGRARQTLALPLFLAALVVFIDQFTKRVVAEELGPAKRNHRTELVGDLLAIHYVENSGAAFGVLRGQAVVLTVVAALVVVALIVSYRRAQYTTWQLATGLGLLLGGAIGNLIDRLRLGYVVDFLAIFFWPKFNVADSAITIGVVLIAWHVLAHDARRRAHLVPASQPALDSESPR